MAAVPPPAAPAPPAVVAAVITFADLCAQADEGPYGGEHDGVLANFEVPTPRTDWVRADKSRLAIQGTRECCAAGP